MLTIKIADTHGFTEDEIIRRLEMLRGKVIGEIESPSILRLMPDDANRRWLTIDESQYAGIAMDFYREKDGIYAEIKPSPALKELVERSSEGTFNFSVRPWSPKGQEKTIIAFDYNPFHKE
ncbi:hypothetical protein CENTIMANUS_00314 [Klebsiella phage vB_KpM_Centimanus]